MDIAVVLTQEHAQNILENMVVQQITPVVRQIVEVKLAKVSSLGSESDHPRFGKPK
jgi:hypothetical protein